MAMTARGFLAAALTIAAHTLLAPAGVAASNILIERKIVSMDGLEGDRFGWAVALAGDTAVVGAPSDDGSAVDQGSAYVFLKQDGLWVQQGKLTADDGATGDGFGWSVALSGDTVLVGASGKAIGGNGAQGAAYVFVRANGAWTQQARLTADDGQGNAYFGDSVAIEGDTAIVGADGADAAYVFTRNGTAWTFRAKLVPSDVTPGEDYFGWSAAIAGGTVVIGSPYDSTCSPEGDTTSHGAAYVFVGGGDTWTEQAKLLATDLQSNAYLGENGVDIDGDTVIVGADGAGAAYVFTRSGVSWSQQAKLLAPDGLPGDKFGYAVVVSGDSAVAGAPGAQIGEDASQGAAYLFTRSGDSWSPTEKLASTDGGSYDRFACALALDGGTLLAGAYSDGIGANTGQGSAYFLTRAMSPDVAIDTAANMPAAQAGDSVILWATAANYGPGDADGLTLTAPLPGGLSPIAHIATHGTWDEVTGEWDLGTLGEGSIATLSVMATVDDTAAGATLVFSASTPRDDVDLSNNAATASIAIAPADIGLLAAADTAAPAVGGTVTITVTAGNLGAGSATGVGVSCPLPSGLSLVSAVASLGAFDAGTGLWELGAEALAAGASATLVIQARTTSAVAGKTVVFSAQTAWADENPANNSSSVSLTVGPQELLASGGMETDANKDKTPDRWSKSGWTSADGRTTATKRSGAASVALTGNGRLKVLQQKITRTGVVGERLTMTAYGKPSSVPPTATFRAELIVYNGSTVVLRKALSFPKGTAGFTKRSATVTVTKPSTSVFVKLSYKGTTGKVWLDDVSLRRYAP